MNDKITKSTRLTKQIIKEIDKLRIKESRTFSNMLEILLREAIKNRNNK